VVSVEALDEEATRPGDFDLADAWAEVVGEMEARRSETSAVVLVPTAEVFVLRDHFGRHCTVEEELGDGRTRVRVAAPTPLDIARWLAGWGGAAEVLSPAAVQQELARIGVELTGRYGSLPYP
jgi:predicted DNA-binding transcriptional regulator YafY